MAKGLSLVQIEALVRARKLGKLLGYRLAIGIEHWTCKDAQTRTVEALVRRGFLEFHRGDAFKCHWVITDAGREALKGR